MEIKTKSIKFETFKKIVDAINKEISDTYDDRPESFEEGVIIVQDPELIKELGCDPLEIDTIEIDSNLSVLEESSGAGEKYQDYIEVYKYNLKDKEVYLQFSYCATGSYYSEYVFFDFELRLVEKHVELKEVISYF